MSKDFIIIEPDPIVRIDLEGTLMHDFPLSSINIGETLGDVQDALGAAARDAVLFVKGGMLLTDVDLLEAVKTLAARGCHIVSIGKVEMLDFVSTCVELPFTTEMVLEAVRPNTDDSRDAEV